MRAITSSCLISTPSCGVTPTSEGRGLRESLHIPHINPGSKTRLGADFALFGAHEDFVLCPRLLYCREGDTEALRPPQEPEALVQIRTVSRGLDCGNRDYCYVDDGRIKGNFHVLVFQLDKG